MAVTEDEMNRRFDNVWKAINGWKKTMQWAVGILVLVALPAAVTLIDTWAQTRTNTAELKKREPDVDKVPLIVERVDNIQKQVDANGDLIKETHNTVNKIAIKLGVEPE